MIPISEAIQTVLRYPERLGLESVELSSSVGRILAEDVIADTDLPPFDRAQMDGYAVHAADVANTPARLRIAGESAAGFPYKEEVAGSSPVGSAICLSTTVCFFIWFLFHFSDISSR